MCVLTGARTDRQTAVGGGVVLDRNNERKVAKMELDRGTRRGEDTDSRPGRKS